MSTVIPFYHVHGSTKKLVFHLQWKVICNITKPGDSVFIVGNHPLLGDWDPSRAVRLVTNDEYFPLWRSVNGSVIVADADGDHLYHNGMRLPEQLFFKHIIKRQNGDIIWEPNSKDRSLALIELLKAFISDPLSRSAVESADGIVESVWGSSDSLRLTFGNLKCSPSVSELVPEFSMQSFEPYTVNNSSFPELGQSYVAAGTGLLEKRHSHHKIRREVFIPTNRGSIAGQYNMLQTIGTGTWGEVRVVRSFISGELRAAKNIPKCYVEDPSRFNLEIAIMKALDHPTIVRLYETFEDATDIFMVMEYCSGGELLDRIVEEGVLDEQFVGYLMRQILEGIAYCHSRGVAHRDLKPENYLFRDQEPYSPLKLIDFGLATKFNSFSMLNTCAGTPYYVSPQVLEGSYGPECDEWSAGVMMYILLCGYPPFCGNNDTEVLRKIRRGRVDFHEADWQTVSPGAQTLVRGLLERHVSLRITAAQALKHGWFQSNPIHWKKTMDVTFDFMSKFRRFTSLSRLKKIALTIVAQHISEDEIKELRQLFHLLDYKRDGVLDLEEIRAGVNQFNQQKSCKGQQFWREEEQLMSIMNAVDTSGSGCIDYTEFIAACLHTYHYQHEDACRKAFRILDRDDDGKISKQELTDVFASAGMQDNLDIHEDVNIALQEADSKDGSISYPEFVNLMNRIPSRSLLNLTGDDKSRTQLDESAQEERVSDNHAWDQVEPCNERNMEPMEPNVTRAANQQIVADLRMRTNSLLNLLEVAEPSSGTEINEFLQSDSYLRNELTQRTTSLLRLMSTSL